MVSGAGDARRMRDGERRTVVLAAQSGAARCWKALDLLRLLEQLEQPRPMSAEAGVDRAGVRGGWRARLGSGLAGSVREVRKQGSGA